MKTAAEIVNGLPREDLEPDPVSRADRPEIDTANLGLEDMAAAAWDAILEQNVPPRIFLYAGALTWIVPDPTGRLGIEVMRQDHVRHHLATVATFIRWTSAARGRPEKKPAFPPVALAADLLAVPQRTLPRLSRLVRVPVFTADGRLLTASGYDSGSGLYVAVPDDLTVPPIAEIPTAEAVAQARALLLEELVVDFPFSGPADRAHALALLLTVVLRECIPGDVPLFVVSKSTPRTGAGLLVKVLSIIYDGMAAAPRTISASEEEMRKRLTSFLLPSPAMILLDNLAGRLDSAALAAILTSGGRWTDRILGQSAEVTVPVRAAFVVTGNNPALSNEIAGRSVLIRLDSKMEDPSVRTGFRHPQIETWTHDNRGRLLAAALTLGRGWIAAGRPRAAGLVFGGFQQWAEILGGVLHFAGVDGFMDNRRLLFEQADQENAVTTAFLSDWWTKYGTAPVTTKELLDLAKNHALPIGAKTDHGMLVRLGMLVGGIVDRWYRLEDALVVGVKRDKGRRGVVAWRLEQGGSGGSGWSDGGSFSTRPTSTSDNDSGGLPGLGGSGWSSSSHTHARARAHAEANGDAPGKTNQTHQTHHEPDWVTDLPEEEGSL
jgi:hypothetical protein